KEAEGHIEEQRPVKHQARKRTSSERMRRFFAPFVFFVFSSPLCASVLPCEASAAQRPLLTPVARSTFPYPPWWCSHAAVQLIQPPPTQTPALHNVHNLHTEELSQQITTQMFTSQV